MVTISMDEGGHFEDLKSSECAFIGGVIFRSDNEDDLKNELSRIRKYLTDTCESVGCAFPYDLHYNREKGRVVNGREAEKVKSALEKSLPDFMQYKGNWSLARPNGTYALYALTGDSKSISDFLRPGISNMIDDKKAGNRYEHMAYRAIENLLFFDPYLNDGTVKLELATRVVDVEGDPDLCKELSDLGKNPKEGETFVSLTNGSSFLAALAETIQDSKKRNTQFNMKVQSINYKPSEVPFGGHTYYQGMLYLADTVCSCFQDAYKGCNSAITANKIIAAECERLTGKQGHLWLYSDIDQMYRDAYKKWESGDFYHSLKEMYEAETNAASKQAGKFYGGLWFEPLRNKMRTRISPMQAENALDRLEDYVHSEKLHVPQAVHIWRILESGISSMQNQSKAPQLLFRLYGIKMVLDNHTGNYAAARLSYKKCVEYSQYVSVEDYLELRNMYAVTLLDGKEFEKALAYTKTTLGYEEILTDLKKELYPENKTVFVHCGRTLSQMGQCYAFMRDTAAEECFRKALDCFGEAYIDRQITLSYLLHYYIDTHNQEEYEKYAEVYFGIADPEKQMERLLSRKDTAIKFGIWVLVKGMYEFYRDTISKNILKNMVRNIASRFPEQTDEHPWEMIFKYCALLLLKDKKELDAADVLMDRANATFAQPKGIMAELMQHNAEQYDRAKQGQDPFAQETLNYMYR